MSQVTYHVIIGLGATGLSCAHYFYAKGIDFHLMDTRDAPKSASSCHTLFPNAPLHLGGNWPQGVLNHAASIVLSPGVPLSLPALQAAKAAGVQIVSDIDVFAFVNTVPVLAITGSNGKSTVTTLVGDMLRAAGKRIAVVGNIGTPVLDIFKTHSPDLPLPYDFIVMELSSFQLETTHCLSPLVATVLNVTPDHLDRYESFEAYCAAKHRIYLNAQHAVINQDDPLSDSPLIQGKKHYFTLKKPLNDQFGIVEKKNARWLAYANTPLMETSALTVIGEHNVANVLSALAMVQAAGLDLKPALEAAKAFKGLEHRCEWVACHEEVLWINDSKGTNIDAALSAVQGIGSSITGKIVLLLGGVGKGADFKPLSNAVKTYCKNLVVMGQDAPIIIKALAHCAPTQQVVSMEDAVKLATEVVEKGDVVLLSPACASFDQYENFAARGISFKQAVKKVLGLCHP